MEPQLLEMSPLVRKKLYGQSDTPLSPRHGPSPPVLFGTVPPQWQFSMRIGRPVALSSALHCVRLLRVKSGRG